MTRMPGERPVDRRKKRKRHYKSMDPIVTMNFNGIQYNGPKSEVEQAICDAQDALYADLDDSPWPEPSERLREAWGKYVIYPEEGGRQRILKPAYRWQEGPQGVWTRIWVVPPDPTPIPPEAVISARQAVQEVYAAMDNEPKTGITVKLYNPDQPEPKVRTLDPEADKRAAEQLRLMRIATAKVHTGMVFGLMLVVGGLWWIIPNGGQMMHFTFFVLALCAISVVAEWYGAV